MTLPTSTFGKANKDELITGALDGCLFFIKIRK